MSTITDINNVVFIVTSATIALGLLSVFTGYVVKELDEHNAKPLFATILIPFAISGIFLLFQSLF